MSSIENPGVQKRKRGIETSNRILRVSAGLFAQKGYDSVTVRKIAEKAGIKESSLYNHFSGKAKILEALFDRFKKMAPESRISEAELDKMLLFMRPEEVFKNILLHVGSHADATLENTVTIINHEKTRNRLAAEIYYKHVVEEPIGYYERLINKMAERKMIKTVDARLLAEQYNYVCIALTKEYFMAKNGLADMNTVIGAMIRALNFFCGLMQE